jgi:hypothetical protein
MSQYNIALVGQMVAGGPTASRQSNDALYPRVAAGDPEAINEMIVGNMSLVVGKVDSYIGCYPHVSHLRDDLIAEGFLGLTVAVNKMAEQGPIKDANPTGYMSYWITYHVGTICDKESANGASDRTTRGRRQEGEELPHVVPMPDTLNDIVVDPTSMVDLRDLIESCCETDVDLAIIRLRERGNHAQESAVSEHPAMVDKEIAKVLDIPHTTVFMLRRAIYARFLEKSGLKGEV